MAMARADVKPAGAAAATESGQSHSVGASTATNVGIYCESPPWLIKGAKSGGLLEAEIAQQRVACEAYHEERRCFACVARDRGFERSPYLSLEYESKL
jgi:hypothetical protein